MEQTVTFEWMTVKRVDPQRLWYLQNGISDHNATVYADILADMEELGSGLFTCTLRITNGHITDYVLMNNNAQIRPATVPTKTK